VNRRQNRKSWERRGEKLDYHHEKLDEKLDYRDNQAFHDLIINSSDNQTFFFRP
jgi:hypothetical protein